MGRSISEILEKQLLSRSDIISLLSIDSNAEMQKLYEKANEIRINTVGRSVYYRGLIEFSNICSKNCFYCG